jgi:hypothetical protein
MGLDMFLTARRHMNIHSEDRNRGQAIAAQFPELAAWSPGAATVRSIEVEVGYWRKANAIHGWFVREVQAGEDDCGTYPVSRTQLRELQRACRAVRGDPELTDLVLPTLSGFFFGSTCPDHSYWNAVRETIDVVDRVLALSNDWTFTYSSSW